LTVKSEALEVNLADYHVDVDVDEKYSVLQEVLSKYYGLMEGLDTFLREISHPYKNWRFIVTEARKYSLEYFHLLKSHPKGPEAAGLLIEIFLNAAESCKEAEVKGVGDVDEVIEKLKRSGDIFEPKRGFIQRI